MKTPNTINGRTPEEIKKGLECCINWETGCIECPYDNLPHDECVVAMKSDNIALIQQLERERDAAVEDLEAMGGDRPCCGTCLHENCGTNEEPCSSCLAGYLINQWQWRGVQEVE